MPETTTPMTRFNWTDERLDQLRTLWSAGQSAAVIGAQLVVSRNAVIGKANRLKLPSRKTLVTIPNQRWDEYMRRPQRRRVPHPRPEPAPQLPSLTEVEIQGLRGVSLLDIQFGQCHYPLERPGPLVYCGSDAQGEYCTFHHKRMRQPARPVMHTPYWATRGSY